MDSTDATDSVSLSGGELDTKKPDLIDLDEFDTVLDDEEEAAKRAALEAIARGEKTPNEDKILAELDEEIARWREEHKGRGFQLDPELVASLEQYLEDMKKRNANRPPVKLAEHPLKYAKNAGNCVTFTNIPVYDPNDPRFKPIADSIKRAMQQGQQKEQPESFN